MSTPLLCGDRTSIGLQNGTLGVCELATGHPGPHQEQRADNGTPRTWTQKAPPVTDDGGEQEHKNTTTNA